MYYIIIYIVNKTCMMDVNCWNDLLKYYTMSFE